MSETVIQIENLSKQYRLGEVGSGTIREDLNRLWARIRGKEDPTLKIGQVNLLADSEINGKKNLKSKIVKRKADYVWALRDINLSVQRGEVLGIIGKNGAGKSTLLKILSKVTSPTTGSITIYGRIASLLEVGTGFHPELSGRDNIFINGAILGMTRSEIQSKFDEIVEFSGVGNYIDTPVKRYSSGMYVRLAFAVAAHLEPEILVVDEVLAVGDAEFQKKALGKMQDVSKAQGRTVIFVSHNMAAVMELCNKCILIENGRIAYSGGPVEVVKKYLNRKDNFSSNLKDFKDREGNGRIRFLSLNLFDNHHEHVDFAICGQDINIVINFEVKYKEVLPPLHFSIKFVDSDDKPIFHVSNSVAMGSEFKIKSVISEGSVVCHIPKFPLHQGEYYFHLFCSDLTEVYDNINFAGRLIVEPGNFYASGKFPPIGYGDFLVENSWDIRY